jgi:hypothetical protein
MFKKFVDVREKFDEKSYFFNLMAYNIAPTLSGLKPSSILNFPDSKNNMYDLWFKYREETRQKLPIEFCEIKISASNVVVLFYNKENLFNVINDEGNARFLQEQGYKRIYNFDECLNTLKERFQYSCPHEIGIFLGIPIKDVVGFIENKGTNYLLNGYWKVYYDVESAKKTFILYDKSRIRILERIVNDKQKLLM